MGFDAVVEELSSPKSKAAGIILASDLSATTESRKSVYAAKPSVTLSGQPNTCLYSPFAGSITMNVLPTSLNCFRRRYIVFDFPLPVEPVTNKCFVSSSISRFTDVFDFFPR